jgi:hypothetical protein
MLYSLLTTEGDNKNMRKVISLLMIYATLAFISVPSQAQFQTPSPNITVSPTAITATATCATTACPTFTIPAGMCTGTVLVTGTNSVLSIVTQVSNNAGTTYGSSIVNIVGAGATGAPAALTTSVIVANGNYSITVPTMTRVRFLINTLTGTNVTIKPVFTSACAAQAL